MNKEEQIKTVTALEHIRLKPEMYIGNLQGEEMSECGIYKLLKLIILNSVDEFKKGNGDIIDIYHCCPEKFSPT